MWAKSQITALSKISQSDLQTAVVYARRYVQPRYRAMLEAKPGSSDWEWIATAGLGAWYLRRRRIAPETAARQLARVIAALEREAERSSKVTTWAAIPWAVAMLTVVKQSHLIAAAFAAGGFAMLTGAVLEEVETAVESELTYLDKFTDEVRAGKVPRDGRFARRAMLYAAAGWGFYQLMRGRVAGQRGYDQERNVLDSAAENCRECVRETGKGWQPIGALVPVGGRQCRSNCRCRLQYRNSRTGEIAE